MVFRGLEIYIFRIDLAPKVISITTFIISNVKRKETGKCVYVLCNVGYFLDMYERWELHCAVKFVGQNNCKYNLWGRVLSQHTCN